LELVLIFVDATGDDGDDIDGMAPLQHVAAAAVFRTTDRRRTVEEREEICRSMILDIITMIWKRKEKIVRL
jgi:hypothetical protein